MIGGDKLDNDFVVIFEGRSIGRIRQADEHRAYPGWDWTINPPLPVPSWCAGSEDSLEQAKAAFREAWEKFYATLTPTSRTGTTIRMRRNGEEFDFDVWGCCGTLPELLAIPRGDVRSPRVQRTCRAKGKLPVFMTDLRILA